MNWSKLIIFLPLLVLILEIGFWQYRPEPAYVDPQTSAALIDRELTDYFHSARIEPYRLEYSASQNEVRFLVKNGQGSPVRVYLNTQKPLLPQVTALQKLLKMSNIKERPLRLVDLAGLKPYATF